MDASTPREVLAPSLLWIILLTLPINWEESSTQTIQMAMAISASDRPLDMTGPVSVRLIWGMSSPTSVTASVTFDHQTLASLLHGDCVCVRRSEHRMRVLHPRGWSFYATLRRKLHWNEGVLPDGTPS